MLHVFARNQAKVNHFHSVVFLQNSAPAVTVVPREKLASQKILRTEVGLEGMWIFICNLAHHFTMNGKEDQIRCLFQLKCFIVHLNHAKFRLPKWRLNDNFSRQGGKASCIGDRIGCNFEP